MFFLDLDYLLLCISSTIINANGHTNGHWKIRTFEGRFRSLELAGRTIAGPVILTMNSAFSEGFCWKTISFLHTV